MASSVAGRLLVATPPMNDPNFERSVVLMLQHDADGAFGVVISRPTEVDEVDDSVLTTWVAATTPPSVFFEGGPVQLDQVLALARLDEPSGHDWATDTGHGVFTVDLNSGDTNAVFCDRLRLFVGYSGWGPSQLDGEIAAGHWFVVDAQPGDAFDEHPASLWRRVLERDPANRDWVRTFPDDPEMN